MTTQLLRTGVLTGCDVTAQAVPNMTVAVAAGSVEYQNASASVAAGNVTITTADATLDRQDAVVASSTGVLSAIAGTLPAAGDNALPPDTTGYVALAYVYVFSQASASYTGTIVSSSIIPLVAQATQAANPLLVHTSPYKVSGLWYGPQGATSAQQQFNTADTLYGAPFFTGKSLSIQAIGINVTTVATGSSVARLGIYSDDGAGTRALLVDAGTTSITSLGDRTISLSQTLTPGWWWLCCAVQVLTGSPFFRGVNSSGVSPIGLVDLSGLATGGRGGFAVSSVSGALPASIVSPSYATNIPIVWVQAT